MENWIKKGYIKRKTCPEEETTDENCNKFSKIVVTEKSFISLDFHYDKIYMDKRRELKEKYKILTFSEKVRYSKNKEDISILSKIRSDLLYDLYVLSFNEYFSSPFTFILSANIFDSILQKKLNNNVLGNISLIKIVILNLALKFEEGKKIALNSIIEDLLQKYFYKITKRELIDFEIKILRLLNFKIPMITEINYILELLDYVLLISGQENNIPYIIKCKIVDLCISVYTFVLFDYEFSRTYKKMQLYISILAFSLSKINISYELPQLYIVLKYLFKIGESKNSCESSIEKIIKIYKQYSMKFKLFQNKS